MQVCSAGGHDWAIFQFRVVAIKPEALPPPPPKPVWGPLDPQGACGAPHTSLSSTRLSSAELRRTARKGYFERLNCTMLPFSARSCSWAMEILFCFIYKSFRGLVADFSSFNALCLARLTCQSQVRLLNTLRARLC
jgi:hypothetical protein